MIDGVELLGFDVFGTVVDWRGSVARHAERFLRAHGIAADPVAFAVAWRDLYQPSMEEVRSGRRPWVRLSVLNRESLLALLARHGVSEGAIPSEAIDELNRAWERLDPWPDVAQGLARLRRRFLLGTISNGHLAGMMRLARHANLTWDAILGAEIARAYKPMPQAYLGSAEAACLPPDRIGLVAAHNDDLLAARAAGLRTLFVVRPTEHGPGQTTDLAAESDWDVVAGDFLELADALGC